MRHLIRSKRVALLAAAAAIAAVALPIGAFAWSSVDSRTDMGCGFGLNETRAARVTYHSQGQTETTNSHLNCYYVYTGGTVLFGNGTYGTLCLGSSCWVGGYPSSVVQNALGDIVGADGLHNLCQTSSFTTCNGFVNTSAH